MPNWTSNTIRIEGAEADLRAFLEAVKWQDEIFDFNRIIPMPELLKHTGSGYQTINGKEVNEWYVIGNETALLTSDKSVRLFTPDEESTLLEIGHRSWYTWCTENWGTKWNARRPELAEDCAKDGYIEIRFDTAWAPPMPVLEKMFEMFPKLSFVCSWENEGESERHSIEHDAVTTDTNAQTNGATMMNLTKLCESDLMQFTGSEQWYRHAINRKVLFTDGAKYVAETAGAYWLLDEIALIQPYDKRVAGEEFQVWKLAVHSDRTATLTCDGGNGNIVYAKEIEFTDFPLDEITFYFANNVIYLPSEH